MSRLEQARWHTHNRRIRILAVVLAGAACLLATPSQAVANDYHVFSCEDPYTGQSAPAADWSFDQGTNGYGDGAGSSCAGGGGSISAWMDGGVTHGFGEGGYANFNAPGAMTIAAFELWRYEAVGPYEPYAAPVTNIAYNPGNVSIEGLCAQSDGCPSRGNPQDRLAGENAVGASGLVGVTQISTSAVCGGGPGTSYVCPTSNAENGNSAEIDIYAADITLEDPTVPTVSNVTGPLTSGATLSGNTSISFNASDSGGPGVYSGSLVVDGHTVVSQILDTTGGACQSLGVRSDGRRSFDEPQPCKSSLSASLTLDTNLLAAGAHSLELIVEDAAGNQAIAYNGTITTSGPPQVGVNGSLTGRGPHIANGDPCAGEALEVAINGERKPPVVPYGKSVTVRGVLHCGTVPIRSARIAVATLGGPASAAISASVQTALDGSFSYEVPAGPDRTLRFSYTAYSDDPGPSATATAAIMISPRIFLLIKPHHTSNRHTIYWMGTITGGPYPQAGVTLDVEVQEGRHWKIFDQVVANGKGRFRYSYRFHATEEPTTYAFRVALPDTGAQDYPYTRGASNTVEVQVDP
jgi:hypothetical protein